MTELDNIKIFFTDEVRSECLSIRKIEEMAGLPKAALFGFLKGYRYRYLTEEQVRLLVPVLQRLGYVPLKTI